MNKAKKEIQNNLSIVLPCLNEEKAIEICLNKIKKVIEQIKIHTEIIIVNNNSTDNSVSIIKKYKKNNPDLNIILVEEKIPGYGSAYQKGFLIANGKYIFMSDLDDTYDFFEIPKFINKIKEGHDLVIGNRFSQNKKGKVGSMPWHHQYIGNPFLSKIVRKIFKIKIRDIHCGARLIEKKALEKISPNTKGMEFASEMIIRGSIEKISMAEISINYNKRIGKSKLNSFKDGWRHLRFILLYSPLLLFLTPGVLLFFIGLISMILLYLGSFSLFNINFYIHPMFISSGLMIIGYQLIYFSFFVKTYTLNHMKKEDNFFEKIFKYMTLKKASLIGIIILSMGLLIYSNILILWVKSGFSQLNEIKNSILALTFLVIGTQTFFSAFMLSILSIKNK